MRGCRNIAPGLLPGALTNEKMKHEEVYLNGEDNGWLKKQNFWFDENHPNGFNIVDLDSIYPEKYFEVDHVKPETIDNYCRLIPEFYEKITGEPLRRVIEFGCAGGWFTERFAQNKIYVHAFEGAQAGVDKAESRLWKHKDWCEVDHEDFGRTLIPTPHSAPIALCTEVAEHVEPPFSAILVNNLISSANLVWFSFEPPNTNPAHIHHPNEMPAKFWINLFDFYGYGCYMLPDWVFDQTEGRGRMIFYNKETYGNNSFFSDSDKR